MAEIRIIKLAKQYNIGLGTLVDFLKGKKIEVEEKNPNAKVSEEEVRPLLDKAFGSEQKAKEEAVKTNIKFKEIIESVSKKKVEKEDEVPEKELVIKSNNLSAAAPKQTPAKPVEEPMEKPVEKPIEKPIEQLSPEPEPVQVEQPKAEEPAAPAPEVVAPAAVQEPEQPIQEPKPVEVAENSGIKVTGKIDLDQFKKKKHGQKPAPAPQPVEPVKVEAPAVEDKPEPRPEPREVKIEVEKLSGPKVVDKIDLSQFNKKSSKKGKRERISGGSSQKIDVTKVDGTNSRPQKGGANGQKKNNVQAQSQGPSRRKRDRDNSRLQSPVMTEEQTEEMQRQIQKQIKETYAKMNETKSKNAFGAKHRKDKREAAASKFAEEMEQEEMEKKVLKVTEFVTVNDLATLMNNTPVTKVIAACMNLGLMVSINQRLDAEALVLVAEEFGYEVEFVTAAISEAIAQESEEETGELVSRPPVITVMGHVDHGKTSLLDYIRKSNVIAGEAGGITQHIGAYNVKLPNGRRITFLDTPGHEAFTAMRARGAKMTDLAIIIIAADDAIMPQTIEAINHAQAAGVPMVFAINKIDKPGANPEKIREQLSHMNILVEDWGGKYQCQEISAKKGINVDLLLEKVLLEADMLDLKATPSKRGTGAVIESALDKGRGYTATVLVQDGTIHVGDFMLCGSNWGRIKAMYNERGQKVTEAGPSTPVNVLGLNGAPTAGENFNIMADEKEAKDIANKREQLLRIQGIKTQKHMTLEEIGRRIAIGNFKELNFIVKGDVDGSVEALSDSIIKLSNEEVRVNVIHKAVGAISESDILLAAASDAIVIGFQVRPSAAARKLAEKEQIEIRLYSVIYDCINEIKDGIEGMLAPEQKEEIMGTAEIQQTFKISKVGTIAGCLVKEGKINKANKVRLIRDGIVIYTGDLGSLKRFKDDAKEVVSGMECGLNIENFNDIKVGDIVESFTITEIKRTL